MSLLYKKCISSMRLCIGGLEPVSTVYSDYVQLYTTLYPR